MEEAALDLARKQSSQSREVVIVGRRKRGMVGGVGRAFREVLAVEMRTLGDGSPFAVEENEGRETVRVGKLEYPIRAMSATARGRATGEYDWWGMTRRDEVYEEDFIGLGCTRNTSARYSLFNDFVG